MLIFATSEEYIATLWHVVRLLREAGIRSAPALNNLSIKSGLKLADRMGVGYAAIIGDSEHASGYVSLKNMISSEQVSIPIAEVVGMLKMPG